MRTGVLVLVLVLFVLLFVLHKKNSINRPTTVSLLALMLLLLLLCLTAVLLPVFRLWH